MFSLKVVHIIDIIMFIFTPVCNTMDHEEDIHGPDPHLSEFVWFTTSHDYYGHHKYVNIHPIILHNHVTPDTDTDNEVKEPEHQKMRIRL